MQPEYWTSDSRESQDKKVRYWAVTIARHLFVPRLPEGVLFAKGQMEIGETTGYEHWQLYFITKNPQSRSFFKGRNGFLDTQAHCEPTRSEAYEAYVWKDETAVIGTRFELGKKPLQRNAPVDWNEIWELAKHGKMMEIPADIRIRCYSTLKRIAKDFMIPPKALMEPCGLWIVGPPGCGKSHYVRENFGHSLFSKPCNKWWDGYQYQDTVLLDDFGKSHSCMGHFLKIWADQYPFIIDDKGGALNVRPKNLVVTSNYTIHDIFAEIDSKLYDAILDRFQIIVMSGTTKRRRKEIVYLDMDQVDTIEEDQTAILDDLFGSQINPISFE